MQHNYRYHMTRASAWNSIKEIPSEISFLIKQTFRCNLTRKMHRPDSPYIRVRKYYGVVELSSRFAQRRGERSGASKERHSCWTWSTPRSREGKKKKKGSGGVQRARGQLLRSPSHAGAICDAETGGHGAWDERRISVSLVSMSANGISSPRLTPGHYNK